VRDGYESDADNERDSDDASDTSGGYGWDGEGDYEGDGNAVVMVEDGRGRVVKGDSLDLSTSHVAFDLIGAALSHSLYGV
jgi:hypothetical protein